MIAIQIHIQHETFRKQCDAQRCNPSLEVTFQDYLGRTYTHTLSAGDSDEIRGYQNFDEVLVFSRNDRIPYYGLQVFKQGEEIGEIFIQTDLDVKDIIGKATSDITIIKRLRERIY